MRRLAVLLALGLAARAAADDAHPWGLLAGADWRKVAATGVGPLLGPQAGLAVTDAPRSAMWQFVGGWDRDPAAGWDVRWVDARLTFTAVKSSWYLGGLGSGIGLEWLDRGGDRRRSLAAEAHLALLLAPGALLEAVWADAPCWPCLADRRSAACLQCLSQDRAHRLETYVQARSAERRFYLGLEGGWRTGKDPLGGPEARAYLLWFPG